MGVTLRWPSVICVSVQPGSTGRCHAAATKEAHHGEEQWSCFRRLQPQHVPLPASPGQHAAPATSLHPHRWASAHVSVTEASSDTLVPEGKQDDSWCLVLPGSLRRKWRGHAGVSSHCMHMVSLCSFSSALTPSRRNQCFPLRLTSARTPSFLWKLPTLFCVCD